MNLRHKKPINSYKGQANCDKNEFNDDDFKHQPSPMKKFNNPSGQQIYKYSRILTKFINNSNQYYRQKLKNGKCPKTEPEYYGQQAKIDLKQMSLLDYVKKKEQPKQKNYIPQIQSQKIQSQIKKQTTKYTPTKKKEEIISPDSNFKKQEKPKASTINQPPAQQPPSQKPQYNLNFPQNNNPYFQGVPNIMGMYSPNLNFPGLSNNMMGMPSIGNFNDQNSQELMLRLAMYDQIIKNNQIKGLGSIMNPNINPNMMMGNYMNMNNIRSPQQMQSMNLTAMNMNNIRNPQQIQSMNPTAMNMNNFINNQILAMMQNQQIKAMYGQGPIMNVAMSAPIYNLTQVYLKKQEDLFQTKKPNPNKKVKRGNYHIGLAYHIYLRNLQKQGKDMRNTMQYDPTLTSKRIKKQQQESRLTTRGSKRQTK